MHDHIQQQRPSRHALVNSSSDVLPAEWSAATVFQFASVSAATNTQSQPLWQDSLDQIQRLQDQTEQDFKITTTCLSGTHQRIMKSTKTCGMISRAVPPVLFCRARIVHFGRPGPGITVNHVNLTLQKEDHR
jgi:hypothetical protein